MKIVSELTIGQAVQKLRANYPELSISKVRYLEEEGLLALKRTKGGYRKFTKEDLQRLEMILKLQKDYFLPLHVIKEKMHNWKGEALADFSLSPQIEEEAEEEKEVKLEEAIQGFGLSPEEIRNLQSFGLLNPTDREGGKVLTSLDFQILEIYCSLAKYGIEPRHLRMYLNFADREKVLFQQIFSPHLKQRSLELRKRGRENFQRLFQLTERLKRLLLQKSLQNLDFLS